ncbi:MAG: hypothetical protein Q4C70_01375 [Planctomycetia bacterium]|nr:hypothetical protein [Planctomycetia bacterium]
MVTENERRYWKKVLYGDLRNCENKRRYERDMAKMVAMERKGGRKTFLGCGCFVWTLILFVIVFFFVIVPECAKRARKSSPPSTVITTDVTPAPETFPVAEPSADNEASQTKTDSEPEPEKTTELDDEPETKPETAPKEETKPETKPKKKKYPKRETIEHGTVRLKKPENQYPRKWTDVNGNTLEGTLSRMTTKKEVYISTTKGTKKFKFEKFCERDRNYILEQCLDYPGELEDAMKEREK